jgi:NodT family efflux transporter outer membrane factor (OMF) lipoprotein
MTLSDFTRWRLPSAMAALLGGGLIAAVLSGCAPQLGPAPKLTPIASLAASQSLAAPADAWPADAWWTAYNDPQLNALEEQALAGAPDLAAAAARVRQAQAVIDQAAGFRLPSLSTNGSIQTSKQSLNEGFPDAFKSFLPAGYHTQTRATADLNWTLDFFGAERARLAAATSAAEAAQAELAAARLQLSTDVAGAYAELARLYRDRDAAAEAVRVRGETLKLVGDRLRNGLETRGELAQAQGGVPAAQQEVDALDRQILVQRHAIAALLGQGPDAGLAIPRPATLAVRPFGLPPTVQVDLVGRRPDLVAARLRAEAAAKRVKAAKADFYPNISITGDYGLTSLGVEKFTSTPDSVIGAIGPAIRLPIFNRASLDAAYKGRRGEYDEAVAAYNRTLAYALRDVADAAAGVQSIETQLADARQALSAAEEAYRVLQMRYSGGLTPYLSVLSAENTLITQRRVLADLEGQAAGLDVSLVRALGGGYVDPAPALRTASR